MTKPKAKAPAAPKKEVAVKKTPAPKKEVAVKKTPAPKKEVAVKKTPAPKKEEPVKHVTKRSIVFDLAKQGLDIQQIVEKTGQPKSSVSWLFSKFQLYREDDAKSLAMKAAKEAREAKKAAEQKPLSKKEAKKFIPTTIKEKVKPVKPAPVYVPFAEEEETSPFANE